MSSDVDPAYEPKSSRPISVRKKIFLCIALVAVLLGYITVGFGRLVLNGSDSLPHHGYFMVTWPKVYWRGCIVAFEPREDIAERFPGLFFVKRVVGLPGDMVENSPSSVCVHGECLSTQTVEGQPAAALFPSGPVPENRLFVLGDTPSSLDSRYAVIGAVDQDEIVAVGFPIPLWHWKEIEKWLGNS